MGHALGKLLALQEVDLQVLSVTDEKAKLLDLINEKKAKVESERHQFEERQAQRSRLKVEIKNLEIELAGTSDHIRKLEAQQVHIKTNQEYKALDKEIYEAKVRQTQVEDQLLQKMEVVEEEKLSIRETKDQLDAQAAELQKETGTIQDRIGTMDRSLAGLQAKRSKMTGEIEENALRLYERILNSKKTPALVPIVNRSCQGCHLAVTAAVESVLRRGEADIITCENCSRILYIPEEENG